MARYRKEPVVIEAVQFTLENTTEVARFLDNGCAGWHVSMQNTYEQGIVIPTLEGDYLAMPGDWIIKGVQGEFYPYTPDFFEATYEGAPDA